MKVHKIFITILAAVILPLNSATVLAVASPPAPPPPGGTFEQRLAQRKTERDIKLDPRDQQRIKSLCVQAQTKIRTVQQTAVPVITNRIKVYQRISAKLWVIIGELKLAEKDTFNLEKQLGSLADLSTNFQTSAANYQQALDDSLLINCQADTAGFKAMFDTARLYHAEVISEAANIRSYVSNDIKATLAEQVSDLQPKATTGGQ